MNRGTLSEPLVSVLTPVYNGGSFLDACVRSVLSQTYKNFELVIVDNHSTDDTAAIAARYAASDERVRVVRPPQHLSQTDNFNFTIGCAAKDAVYIKTVHADDSLLPECIERMVAVGERHPSAGVIGAMRFIDREQVDLIGVPPNCELVSGRWLIRTQLLGAPYTTGPPTSTMLRASVIRNRVPLYDPSYEHNDDALMYFLLRSVDFGYCPTPLTRTALWSGSRTSWTTRVGTWTPDHLRMVLDYATDILEPAELDAVTRRLEKQYEVTLAKWAVNLKLVRNRDVFRYHRAALLKIEESYRKAGRTMPRALRLYAAMLGAL